MAYSAEISRSNPTCFIFVIDQSGSMADSLGGESIGKKADFMADVVNRTLHDLVIRCTKTEEIRNYYHVAVIGYGDSVKPILAGNLSGRELVPIAELADNPARRQPRQKSSRRSWWIGGAAGAISRLDRSYFWRKDADVRSVVAGGEDRRTMGG